MMTTFTIRELAAHLSYRISIGVAVVPVRLVVDLMRRIADILLPMSRPVQVFVSYLLGRFGVTTHHDAIDHTSDKCHEAEYQENYTQNPKFKKILWIASRYEIAEEVWWYDDLPYEQRFHELNDNDETQCDQDQTKVQKKH